jgi:hypothetical protein
MTRRVLAAVVTATVLISVVGRAAQAGTDVGAPGIRVTTPSPAGFTSYGGMRLQAIGSTGPLNDDLLGVADLTPATNRIEFNFNPPRFVANGNSGGSAGNCVGNYGIGTLANPVANAVTFTWDRSADTLTSRMVNATLNCTLVSRNFTTKLAAFSGWTLARTQTALAEANAVRLSLDDRQAGSQVTFGDVNVDGSVAIGPFDPGPGAATTWLGTGYDFAAERIHHRGTMYLGGTFGACDTTCGWHHVRPLHAAEPAAGGSGRCSRRVGVRR